jgi:hypothetical protein
MALTRAEMINQIEAAMQDSTNTVFSVSEIEVGLVDALRQLSEYVPYDSLDVYTLETRTGSATSTLASHLVDVTNLQFLASDVGKWVYNATDKNWAVITAYTSTSDVTLSRDIFTSGESYSIFNVGCNSIKQINIASSLDNYMDIISVEWPRGTQRNKDLMGDILTLDIDSDPASTDDLEVWVHLNRPHGVYDDPETTAPAPTTYTITASVDSGDGTIDPEGAVDVTGGEDQAFLVTAGDSYIGGVSIDGEWIDKATDPNWVCSEVNGEDDCIVGTYTFAEVSADHTIAPSFISGGNE